MKNLPLLLSAGALAAMVAACGASFPPPNERLANAEAASRSARELGADRNPQAALHLKFAREQIDQAKALMADNDNKRADRVLQRANADAELSVMLAKEVTAKADADKAQERVKALKGGR